MKLSMLLKDTDFTPLSGSADVEISSLVYDSRKAEKGSLFVCIKGAASDGHDYIDEVIKKGASAIVVEQIEKIPENVTVIQTADTRLALALLSSAWFDYPAKKLTVIGVTGTKGKTTTTYMIKKILEVYGKKTGLIGTIEVIIGDEHIHALNTTPESYLLQEYFAKMVESGCTHAVMEVSSQALMMKRTAGVVFDIGVFTNIEPDHIGPNEHSDFNDYLYCKSLLFKQCKTGLFNIDAEHLKEIMDGHTCKVLTFGLSGNNRPDFAASSSSLFKEAGSLGVTSHISCKSETGTEEFEVKINMPGMFSIHNALGAIAVSKVLGVSNEAIKEALSHIRVNGRVELMPVSERFTVIIDYAHNAMGLKSLLETLKKYEPERLICLFGCGGNRDRERRFQMGEISSKLADLTVITSDNPRFEEPLAIIKDIVDGVKRADGKYTVIPDRREAIKETVVNAKDGDVIVIAGKGHEDYQEINGIKYHMDDHETVMNIKV